MMLPATAMRHDAADRKSTRLNSSHQIISYAGVCLKKKKLLSACSQGGGEPTEQSAGGRGAGGAAGARSDGSAGGASGEDAGALADAAIFFNDTATTELDTLSLHDALPI